MTKNRRSKQSQEPNIEEIGLDEVDEFAQEREKVLLNEAGWDKDQVDSSESEEEEAVMDIEEEGDDDKDKADIESYRKRLQGPVEDDEEEYFIDKDKEEADNEDDDDGDDDDEAWGNIKGDYYGAEDLEEEDDEDAKEMEKEALRLQKKHLEDLNMDAYMLDETVEEWTHETKKEQEAKKGEAEEISITEVAKLDKDSQLQILQRRYPEFIPLTKEFQSLKGVLKELEKQRDGKNEVVQIKYSTLASYLGTVATYFALFVSKLHDGEQFSMKGEPILEAILNSREIWYEAKGLNETGGEEEKQTIVESSEESLEEPLESLEEPLEIPLEKPLEEPLEESDSELAFGEMTPSFTLEKKSIKHLKRAGIEGIDNVDAEEKRGRRRALGFYTSKIDQREKKKMTRFQGDEDIPYKERLYERQQRLLEEARKRGDRNNKKAPGVDLDDDEFNERDTKDAREINLEGEDYYEAIKQKKEKKKATRKNAHELAVRAAKEGKLAELQEGIDGDGKRAINYQMLKNRGLTKKRNKADRNSRVKKRKRYDQAKKKLGSVRAVYKTPEGPYQGEKTGIKKNISRSVKMV
ncbi:hypothetical protein FOA43_002899 [Brettanomyces nanus]|uniref:Sas10 C-terminal domain-containing protein n=1 Tax=Eeniella nana TaxID=13502 RepID=A0A875S8Y5_EENNA|nr:uncharacterized protein FOA43_002899 [Brettanomyces nanus]QPG75544.1 hypothetical protein FOA43_002899 [Brettanomyces nanus]